MRRAAPRPRAAPHRRAVALGAVGLAGRERTRLARPVPRAGVRRPRPRRLRLEGAGRGLLRRLRGEDRRAHPVRRRGDVGAAERRPAGLPRARRRRESIDARFVVAATGPFQRPVIPPIVPDGAVPLQIHSSAYRNPEQLPEGAVLVVGAGSSGVQIADELRRSGRRVHLSVGPHDRPPRSYRGRDFCWWLGVLGMWDAETPPRGRRARHDRGQRRARRAHGRLPRPRRQRHRPRRQDDVVRRRHPALRAGPRRQHRPRRRQLPVAARRRRRLRRAQRPRSPRGAGGPHPGTRSGLRDRSAPRARPRRRRGHLDRLGDRLRHRLRLAAGRCLRRERPAAAPARRLVRARRLLPRAAVAVPARIELHLGRLARRQAHRRPHRDPARLPRPHGRPTHHSRKELP